MKTAAIFTTLLISFSAATAQAETYAELLDKSAKAMIAEQWRTSLQSTRSLLALPYLTREQRAEGLNHLCIALNQMGRVTAARRACDESIALNGKAWGTYINRGNVLSAEGHRISAKADYRKAKELNPATEMASVAETMQPMTPYVFAQPPYAGATQSAQSEQILAEP